MSLKEEILRAQKWLEVTLEQEKQMKMFKSCLTVREIFNQHLSSHQGLVYKRIPLADCSAPREEVKMHLKHLKPLQGYQGSLVLPLVVKISISEQGTSFVNYNSAEFRIYLSFSGCISNQLF